jgi:biotin carboxyl carrier protein
MDAPKKYLVTLGTGGPTPIQLSFDGHGAWKAVSDDLVMSIGLDSVEGDIVKVTVDGRPLTLRVIKGPDGEVRLEKVKSQRTGGVSVRVRSEGEVILGSRPAAPAPVADPVLVAPITGVILAVEVAVGDTVTEGQPMMVLEAMKMETVLRAPRDGVVKTLNVVVQDRVRTDDVLAELE